jgi:hypothetical protein
MAGQSNGRFNLFYRLIKETDLSVNLIHFQSTIGD